jgi:plastocyanin
MQKPIFIACLFLAFPLFALAHGGEHDELIIRMTENGFEPRELTVTAGDEVLFINNDERDRWPASNFHPTHTLYPEFDTKDHVKPGESWKFTFNEPGTWRMHDHLIPHFTGTIVVLEDPGETTEKEVKNTASSQSQTIWSRIKAFFKKLFSSSQTEARVSSSRLAEFTNKSEGEKYAWLEDIAARESPETAWQYVLAAYQTPEGVVGNPHDMAHLVGQLLYKDRGFDGLSTCTPVFAFGCYHGLMEVAFDKDKPEDYKKNLALGQEGCKIVGPEDSPSYWSCIHGIGHGVVTFREHDVNKALTDCDLLSERVRTYCHDGVFMELSISAPANFYKKENLLYPCDMVGESYKVACARSQVQVMRQRFGRNTAQIAAACRRSGNSNIIYHCVDSLGYFTGQVAAGNAERILAGCREIAVESDAAQCSAAAAGELVFQDTVGWKQTTEAICRGLKNEYQAQCRARIEQVKQSYGRN